MERTLRVLHTLLGLLMVLAGIGSLIAIATAPATIGGSQGVGLNASVDPPFRVSGSHLTSLAVDASGHVIDDRSNEERSFERARLTVNAHIPPHDRDSRVVIVSALLLGVAGWWAGLIALRRIVAAARDGDPFNRRNVGRLRLLAGLLFATPLLVAVANRILEGTFDSRVVHPHVAEVNTATMVVIALGVFVLGEVFRKGAELQEFEESTV